MVIKSQSSPEARLFVRCIAFILAVAAGSIHPAEAATMDTVGAVRVSCLSDILVRIESKNSAGNFEDRPTMLVMERNWPTVQRTKTSQGTTVVITTGNYTIQIPNNGSSINGTQVISGGQVVFSYTSLPSGRTTFPAPDGLGNGYVISDNPRIASPPWGGTPMPAGALLPSDPLYSTHGWDNRYSSTPDVYIFVNPKKSYFDDYVSVRKAFLRLSGPIPIVPLFYLGFANSRWQSATQSYFVQMADRYRSEKIPIDIYICDKDWRQNDESYNYGSNFPNPRQFFTDMHSRHFKVAFNDHPFPWNASIDLQRWWDMWTPKLDDGMDFWWFDRNWDNIPNGWSGLEREVWMNRLYWDIQKKYLSVKYQKSLRPCLLSHPAESDENGTNNPMLSPHPAAHRYPGWWTGDIDNTFPLLRKSVIRSVADGISLLPFTLHDIAGYHGCDGNELYTRWMQFGSFCAQPRVHSEGCTRFPWDQSNDTKIMITRYLMLRYRLMPMMYTGWRTCYEDGTPLLRRCDLEWPASIYAQAKNNEQYLFGDDILFRPVTSSGSSLTAGINSTVWLPPGKWFDAWTGEPKSGSTAGNPGAEATVSSRIWHEPMFIRQGAIIAMCPDMQYTSEKPWDPLTLEIYPPADGGSSMRVLYEDDKETYEYENGAFTKTAIRVDRSGNDVSLTIGGAEGGNFAGKLATRAYIVRIHADRFFADQTVTVNSASITVGQAWTKGLQPQTRRIDPASFPAQIDANNFPIPLQGEGQAPGPLAPGQIIEIWLPPASTAQPRVAGVSFQTPAEPVFYGIRLSPKVKDLLPGSSLQYEATAIDQYQQPLAPQPQFRWNVSGGQTISSTGLFAAGAQEGGPYTVTVSTSVGGVNRSDTALVSVRNQRPGLRWDYYEIGGLSALPNFASLTPVRSGIAVDFMIDAAMPRPDNFAVRFSGFIDIVKDGQYTFTTISDDGSALWIGDTKVVDNDSLHAPMERSGTIQLSAGMHPIRVTFFEAGGGEELQVLWLVPGTTSTKDIPGNVLFHTPDSATDGHPRSIGNRKRDESFNIRKTIKGFAFCISDPSTTIEIIRPDGAVVRTFSGQGNFVLRSKEARRGMYVYIVRSAGVAGERSGKLMLR